MTSADPSVPYGYCHCGCGEKTNLVERGRRRGQPRRFLFNHHARLQGLDPLDQYALQPESGCWEWTGTITRYGYGSLSETVDGVRRAPQAHVVVYERLVGPVPDGLELDHLCRNRACVNPAHLEPVTHAENVRRGSAAKLSPEDVHAIRASPLRNRDLAAAYGVDRSTISRVRCGRTWNEEAA